MKPSILNGSYSFDSYRQTGRRFKAKPTSALPVGETWLAALQLSDWWLWLAAWPLCQALCHVEAPHLPGLAVVGLVAVAGSLAFVPGTLPRGSTPSPRHAAAAPNMETENGWGSLPTLEILAKGCDIRLDCDTREKQFAWAKAYYRKYNKETDGKDPKYSQPSTGAGVYRKLASMEITTPRRALSTPSKEIGELTDSVARVSLKKFEACWLQCLKKSADAVTG
eukprot:s839_g21.t1